MITTVLFYIIAAMIVFTALKMVLSTNLVHSALFMAATFIGIALIYILLNAEYLAIVQIMIYVGAVSILFVFGVMLTKRNNMQESSKFNRYKIVGAFVALAFLIVLARTIFVTNFTSSGGKAEASALLQISSLLLSNYTVAFEISGMLLLVAMVGAIIIGKGVNE